MPSSKTHQLGAYVPVDHTRDHDRRQSYTVRYLPQRRPGVSQSRRDSVAACICVDDNADDQVEGRVCYLKGV